MKRTFPTQSRSRGAWEECIANVIRILRLESDRPDIVMMLAARLPIRAWFLSAPDEIERNQTPPNGIPNVLGICLNRCYQYLHWEENVMLRVFTRRDRDMWTRNNACVLRRVLLLTVLLAAVPVLGQDLFIYPTKGQSPEQQSRDRYECHTWAVQQSGFNPTAPQTAQTPPPAPEAPQGGLGRGAARGAAVGAVGGAIAGDAGKGAAIGAATGTLFGGMRRADQLARQQQAQAEKAMQQQTTAAQGRAAYNRALGACLTGRGYTVQ
jgi:hypothetical protein